MIYSYYIQITKEPFELASMTATDPGILESGGHHIYINLKH